MERIKKLDPIQKGILILMLVMTLVFAVVYIRTISRVGFAYQDAILIPSQEGGNTVYVGKVQGQPACFSVSKDKSVAYQLGDKTYGPYTAKIDPTAIPKEETLAEYMTGLELYQGDTLLFRGGVLESGETCFLYTEDGNLYNFGFSYVDSQGIQRDENGNKVDSMAPSASTILDLMKGPELTHKGRGAVWFVAVFFCVLNGWSILFADELFRRKMAWRIRDPEKAEPSEWEILGRYISWILMTVMVLLLFIVGLQ